MNRILRSLLEDFLKQYELKSQGESVDFEKFVNFSILYKEYSRGFDFEIVRVGKGDDTGIDGLAIIVNGQLIQSKEEIDFLIENNGYLEAKFIFIQSKTSSHFEGKEIHNFAFGVEDFFSDSPKLRRNKSIQNLAEISDYLFQNASSFRSNPICKLYYVTTGKLENDDNLNGIKKTVEENLGKTNLFEDITCNLYGADEIIKAYRASKHKVEANIVFSNRVTLPELPGIKESYFGILPFKEFKNILIDENDNLKNIFYDNIRDFQGLANPVNKTIAETLDSDDSKLFTVLNNGITVIANSLKVSGNKFFISDYQVVNGCQTSNVIHTFRHKLDPNLGIPIKLIVTDDEEVKNKIIVATNSQTSIKREQLKAMTDFQKNLEQFYKTIEGEGKLYYERRSGQYQSDSSVIKSRIITIQTQIKSFSSLFLKNPHRVISYFGDLVKQYVEGDSPKIFNPKHQYLPYYMTGFMYYRLDSFFRSQQIDSKYRKIKFFLIMLFGLMQSNEFEPLPIKSLSGQKETKRYCNPIIEILNNRNKCLETYKEAIDVWEASGIDLNDKQVLKQGSTTNKLIEILKTK